jgi:hypothetical protein
MHYPVGPYTYIDTALDRGFPANFYITGSPIPQDPLRANPIVAVVKESKAHTRAERREFLNNIVSMLELMEAQRDVDRN